MIGLGSNRLSVCRRGGMSVTQAGRGGMEWLGVRGPSWASPYSAQATAALLAQFPTQWPTIRDYGFAHPALVPFINANYLIAPYVCGCIEPDEAYPIKATKNFQTGYVTKNNSWIKCISYCVGVPSGYKSIFVSGDYQKAYSFYCQTNGGNTFTLSRGTSGSYNFSIQGSTFGGKSYTIEGTQSHFKLTQGTNVIRDITFYPWYGWPMNVYYSADAWQWQVFQIGEGENEVHRYFALTDNYIWDYVTETLIDNN